jgi:hypothetical protein
MGNPLDSDVTNDIKSLMDCLIEELLWYKQYISTEFVIPENSRAFVSRNVDIMRDATGLVKSISKFRQCTLIQDYSLTPEEMVIKTLQAQVMMRHAGLL